MKLTMKVHRPLTSTSSMLTDSIRPGLTAVKKHKRKVKKLLLWNWSILNAFTLAREVKLRNRMSRRSLSYWLSTRRQSSLSPMGKRVILRRRLVLWRTS